MRRAVFRVLLATACLQRGRAFTSLLLQEQLCRASVGIVRLPDERDVDYRSSHIPGVLASELEYIYARTGNRSVKRVKQFIGGRKALREVVAAEHPLLAVPPIFNNIHGAPELPENSHLMCSISHKDNYAVAAAKLIRPTNRVCRLGE